MTTREMAKGDYPLSFGAFYPTGHVVIFFANPADAERAREALLSGGYEEDDILHMSSEDVVSTIERMRPHVSLLAQFGSETQQMERHYELAKQGCDKLIVYAPTEAESKRAMNVARRFDVKLAEKYHRLVMEDLET
jgi:hypothetical protein